MLKQREIFVALKSHLRIPVMLTNPSLILTYWKSVDFFIIHSFIHAANVSVASLCVVLLEGHRQRRLLRTCGDLAPAFHWALCCQVLPALSGFLWV